MTAPHDDPEEQFARRLNDLNDRLATGIQNTDLDTSDDPDLRSRLAEARECLEILNSVWPQRVTDHHPTFTTRDDSKSTYFSADRPAGDLAAPYPEANSLQLPPIITNGALGEIGRFQIKKELGRGGQGIV